jgi:hypothetical protein
MQPKLKLHRCRWALGNAPHIPFAIGDCSKSILGLMSDIFVMVAEANNKKIYQHKILQTEISVDMDVPGCANGTCWPDSYQAHNHGIQDLRGPPSHWKICVFNIT